MSSTTPSASPSAPGAVELLAVLEGEYAAVFAYGVVGARGGDDRREAAAAALAAHRAARDWVRDALSRGGTAPPPPANAYATGEPADADQAAALAVAVEEALVPRWAAAAGALPTSERAYCAGQAQADATRAISWGGRSAAFPGTLGGAGGSAGASSSPTT